MIIGGIDLEYRPKLPVHRDRFGIGIVGAGGIIQNCHIPAYKMAGFRIVGMSSRKIFKKNLAQECSIPFFCQDYQDLILRDDVDVVDISVPPHLQADIAIYAAQQGKHLLCQKPLATTFKDAKRIVEAAEKKGVKLAVNQNGRWDPAIQASKKLIQGGYIGEPVLASMELRVRMPWQEYYLEYRNEYSKMMILSMSLHHIDQYRYLFGDPIQVWASSAKYPNQPYPGDTIALYSLEYPDHFIATSLDNGFTWTSDYGINYRFEGTEGVVKGKIGWPDQMPSTVSFYSNKLGPVWYNPEYKEKWFPHAFMSTMGDLMSAIENDTQPELNGKDNLRTLQVVFAAYKSIEEKRMVSPNEII